LPATPCRRPAPIAWRRVHSLRDPRQVCAWLVAIAARQALRRQRSRPVVVKVATLDRRHFGWLRPRHRDSIDLLPA
jgi:DNA-directed RNA polymerase specialized sigma24 family protein